MKYEFDKPKDVVVTFYPRYDGFCKKPLLVKSCVGLKTGETVVVSFLAKDGQVHRHRYPLSMIFHITSDSEVIFEAKLRIFKKTSRREIEEQFCEELQELLDRYKVQLSVPTIMRNAQKIFHNTLSIKTHPELHPKCSEEFIKSVIEASTNQNNPHRDSIGYLLTDFIVNNAEVKESGNSKN